MLFKNIWHVARFSDGLDDEPTKRNRQLMRQLRSRGWQLDRQRLDQPDKNGDWRVIPSPERSRNKDGWIYESVPTIPPDTEPAKPKAVKRGTA